MASSPFALATSIAQGADFGQTLAQNSPQAYGATNSLENAKSENIHLKVNITITMSV